MSNEPYLWDKSGPVDPFVAKLERCLQPKRARLAAASRRRRPRLLRVAVVVLAAAAAVAWMCFGLGERDVAAPRTETPPVAAEQPAAGEMPAQAPTASPTASPSMAPGEAAPGAAPADAANAAPAPAADSAVLRSK